MHNIFKEENAKTLLSRITRCLCRPVASLAFPPDERQEEDARAPTERHTRRAYNSKRAINFSYDFNISQYDAFSDLNRIKRTTSIDNRITDRRQPLIVAGRDMCDLQPINYSKLSNKTHVLQHFNSEQTKISFPPT